jgi:hypothetical protein
MIALDSGAAATGIQPSDVIALAALAVAALTLVLTELRARHERTVTERRLRQARAADAIGPVVALLDDADPALVFNTNAETPEKLARLDETWKTSVRGPLLALAVSSLSADERRLARALSVAVHNALYVTSTRAMHFVDRSRDQGWTDAEARAEHDQARRLVNELAAVVRGDL